MFKLPSAQEWAICLALAAGAALAGPSSAHVGTASCTITEAGTIGLNVKKSQVNKSYSLLAALQEGALGGETQDGQGAF